MKEFSIKEIDVQKLSLKEDDKLIVSVEVGDCSQKIIPSVIESVKEAFKRMDIENKCLFTAMKNGKKLIDIKILEEEE